MLACDDKADSVKELSGHGFFTKGAAISTAQDLQALDRTFAKGSHWAFRGHHGAKRGLRAFSMTVQPVSAQRRKLQSGNKWLPDSSMRSSEVSLRWSGNALTLRMLAGDEKGLHKLAFATNGHARKPLVPLTLRNVRLGVEPFREQFQLSRRDLPALDAIEQMLEESRRDVPAADLRHGRF